MSDIKCGKLDVVCRECAPTNQVPTKDYIVNTLTLPDEDTDDLRLSDMSISLVGEPASASFGVSFRGNVAPRRNMLGGEVLVARFYIRCEAGDPKTTGAINVGTADLHTLKVGRNSFEVVATTQGSTFVPLKDIQCVRIDLQY